MNQALLTEVEEKKASAQGEPVGSYDFEMEGDQSLKKSNEEINMIINKKEKSKKIKEEKQRIVKEVISIEGKRGLLEPVLRRSKKEEQIKNERSIEKSKNNLSPGRPTTGSPKALTPSRMMPAIPLKNTPSKLFSKKSAIGPKGNTVSNNNNYNNNAKSNLPTTFTRNEVSPKAETSNLIVTGKKTPSPKLLNDQRNNLISSPPPTEERERGTVNPYVQNSLRSPSSGARKYIDNENSDHESTNSKQSNPYRRKLDISKKLEEDKKKYDKFLLAPKTLKVNIL